MPKSAPPARPPITTNPDHLDNLVASYLAGKNEPTTAAGYGICETLRRIEIEKDQAKWKDFRPN